MRTYLIGYDLNRPGQNYSELFDAIKEIGTWWHHLDSTWIVKTNLGALEIANLLWPHMDNNDELLVVRLQGEVAWAGFSERGAQWLKDNVSYE